MFRKKLVSISLVFVLVFGFMSVCGFNVKAAKYMLNVGMAVSELDSMYKGSMYLKERVEERTDGNLVIKVFPNSQLGNTDDLQEQARMGANVGVITDTGRLADLVPEVGILNAPFIATSYEETKKIVLSDVFNDIASELEDYDYKILSFNWYQGARHLLTNKPVYKPEDLKGLKLRTPGSAVWRESVAAMGATPTPLSWSEVYPAIQQGVIDGAEAQNIATYGATLYEVVDYITKTGHFQLMTGLVVGTQWFNTLPEEYQKILMEEAVKAGDYASQLTNELSIEYEKEMEKNGVTIIEVDKTPFINAVEKVYSKLGYEELRERIQQEVLN